MSIRIAVAEDQRLVRELLVTVLKREADFEVVGTASAGRETVALVQAEQPDILVLDVTLPELDGMEVARAVRKTQPKLAILALPSTRSRTSCAKCCAPGPMAMS